MNMFLHKKHLKYIFLLIFSVSLLSIGIDDYSLEQGRSLPGAISNPTAHTGSDQQFNKGKIDETAKLSLFQNLFSVLIVALLISSLFALFNKLNRKTLTIIAIIVTILVFLFVIADQFPSSNINGEITLQENENTPSSGELVFSAISEPPSFLIWIVGIGFIVIVVMIFVVFLSRTNEVKKVADPLLLTVDKTLSLLNDGNNFQNVIFDCYSQMIEVMKEEFNINQDASVTANEFKELLIRRGLPVVPVNQITSLFEKIRYGSKSILPEDEKNAINCLLEIKLYCQNRNL